MKKIILMLFVICSSMFANQDLVNQYRKDFAKLGESQIELARDIFYKAKPYDLSFTAVAIAWHESNLGEYPVNLQDPSCGPFHINLNTYVKRYGIKNTGFHKNRACSMLINDLDVSLSAFLAEVEAWKVVHHRKGNKSFDYIYRSYNAGYRYDSEQALAYSESIKARIKVLKEIIGDLE